MSDAVQNVKDWFNRQHPAAQYAMIGALIGSVLMGLVIGNFGIAANGGAAGFSGWFTGLWVGALVGAGIWGFFKKS